MQALEAMLGEELSKRFRVRCFELTLDDVRLHKRWHVRVDVQVRRVCVGWRVGERGALWGIGVSE